MPSSKSQDLAPFGSPELEKTKRSGILKSERHGPSKGPLGALEAGFGELRTLASELQMR